jgi:hypothetical protein
MQNRRENRGLLTVNAQNARNLRDPEDRIIDQFCSRERKDKMMDKTIVVPQAIHPHHYPIPTKTLLDHRGRRGIYGDQH